MAFSLASSRGSWVYIATSLIASGATVSGAQAGAIVLGVDFGAYNGTVNSPLQTGFSGFNLKTADTVGPFTNTFTGIDTNASSGTISITVNNGTDLTTSSGNAMLARDNSANNASLMNSGEFTYSDIYRDVIKSKSSAMSIGVGGLNANTQYSLTFYAYDTFQSRTMTFRDFTTGVAGASVAISWNKSYQFSSSTPNSIYSGSIVVTTDSAGQLLIRNSADSNQATLSALTISTVDVPEPAALGIGLLTAGLLSLAGRKRR